MLETLQEVHRDCATPLPHIFAIARNFALNLYRDQMFENGKNSTTMLLCIEHTENF